MHSGLENGPKVTVIGGGTGLSVVLRGFKEMTNRLTAVVTVADDGGGSGVLREDLGMLPPGDIRSCILALADAEELMMELLRYRFTEGMLQGQSFGNLLIAALNGICGNFEEAVAKTHEILRVKGRVLPVSGSDVRLCAELESGQVICGESRIPAEVLRQGSPIQRVYLTPEGSEANVKAVEAIKTADLVVMGPGSLFTSIIPNFLVHGIPEAIQASMGRKILVCNMMTQPGETDGYSVLQHVRQAQAYLGKEQIEYVIANNKIIDGEILAPYQKDGARQILPTEEDRRTLREEEIMLIENNFSDIQKGYIRHDAGRIASVVISLLNE